MVVKLFCDLSKYDNKLIEILQRNPHTAQFFCTFNNSKVITDNKNNKNSKNRKVLL